MLIGVDGTNPTGFWGLGTTGPPCCVTHTHDDEVCRVLLADLRMSANVWLSPPTMLFNASVRLLFFVLFCTCDEHPLAAASRDEASIPMPMRRWMPPSLPPFRRTAFAPRTMWSPTRVRTSTTRTLSGWCPETGCLLWREEVCLYKRQHSSAMRSA